NNRPPVLAPISNQDAFPGQTLSFTISATDTDLPPQILTFTLEPGAPSGASIYPNTGNFTWTPSPSQAPSTNQLSVRVTDNGTPNLSATNSFALAVQEVNTPPVLPTLHDRTVVVATLLTVTNAATDADLPPNALTYTLVTAPDGASIDANGVITWTPNHYQARSTNVFVTVVTDSNPAAVNATQLSATNSFAVFVREANVAPVLPLLNDQTIAEF